MEAELQGLCEMEAGCPSPLSTVSKVCTRVCHKHIFHYKKKNVYLLCLRGPVPLVSGGVLEIYNAFVELPLL